MLGADILRKRLDSLQIKHHGGNVSNGILLFLDERLDPNLLVESLRQKKNLYPRGV